MLSVQEIGTVVRALPAEVRYALVETPRAWVAGGFIGSVLRGETPADLDLFCTSRVTARRLASVLKLQRETDNAYSGDLEHLHVQVIKRWTFRTPHACLRAFDFTLCQAAVGFGNKDWYSVSTPEFTRDYPTRTLIYTQPKRKEECAGSFLRAIKFARRGYTLPLRTLAEVTARMARETRLVAGLCNETEVANDLELLMKHAGVGISSSNV